MQKTAWGEMSFDIGLVPPVNYYLYYSVILPALTPFLSSSTSTSTSTGYTIMLLPLLHNYTQAYISLLAWLPLLVALIVVSICQSDRLRTDKIASVSVLLPIYLRREGRGRPLWLDRAVLWSFRAPIQVSYHLLPVCRDRVSVATPGIACSPCI